jgi:hypothetical protein
MKLGPHPRFSFNHSRSELCHLKFTGIEPDVVQVEERYHALSMDRYKPWLGRVRLGISLCPSGFSLVAAFRYQRELLSGAKRGYLVIEQFTFELAALANSPSGANELNPLKTGLNCIGIRSAQEFLRIVSMQ